MNSDIEELSAVDGVMASASLLFLISSFLPMVTGTAPVFGFAFSATLDSWHSYGTAGVLIGLVGIGLWAVGRFGGLDSTGSLGRNWQLIAAGLILLGTLLVLIRAIAYTGDGGQGVSVSIGYGAILLIIAGIVAAACSAMRSRVDEFATRAVASARTASRNARAARARRGGSSSSDRADQ